MIHNDSRQHTTNGGFTLNELLRMVELKGCDNYFRHKKKGHMFKDINVQLYAIDGTLSHVT